MAPFRRLPPIEVLRENFEYDHEEGLLHWKVAGQDRRPDRLIQGIDSNGYSYVVLNSRGLRVHRVAWAMHYGEDPGEFEIDHMNRNCKDNRILNLRKTTRTQNCCNSLLNKTKFTKSGVRGVSWDRHKWRAHIRFGGKKHRSKRFSDLMEAVAVRTLVEFCLQGEHSMRLSRSLNL